MCYRQSMISKLVFKGINYIDRKIATLKNMINILLSFKIERTVAINRHIYPSQLSFGWKHTSNKFPNEEL